MRVLMVGDIIGRPGRNAVNRLVPQLRSDHMIDIVIANGENVAGGFGITYDTAQELLSSGVDIITTGNHVWKKREIVPYMQEDFPLIRPANFPPGVPGRGYLNIGNATQNNLLT